MSDSEWKQKGNAAYSKGEWELAVTYYTKALKVNTTNDALYSNRSAAYMKLNDYENALKDANKCIALNPKNHKGYGRKGAAYHAMKKYDRAIATYKEAIKVCPDEKHLQLGLAASKRAALENSKVNKALRKTEATKKATKSRTRRVKDAEDVSDFVKQTRQELKLQLAAIQSQLDLINELAAMDENEKLDLLFTLIDSNGDGTVDAKELAMAMRKRNNELSFHDSIENAIDMVATFDSDGDAKLDHNEFRNYINVMLKELGVNFAEFSEFLVIQILFSDNNKSTTTTENNEDKNPLSMLQNNTKDGRKNQLLLKDNNIEEEVKAREVLFDMLSDERMVELFRLFDPVENTILFYDVATALYVHAIENMKNKKTNCKKLRIAYTILLMMDKNVKRTLNYEQFGRLIMAFVAIANATFDDIADDLTVALATKQQEQQSNSMDALNDQLIESLFITDSIYQITKDINKEYTNRKKTRRSSVDDSTVTSTTSASSNRSSGSSSLMSSPTKKGKQQVDLTPSLSEGSSSTLMDPLTFGRLSKLFQLWDTDGDGSLTLKELTYGLRRFQSVSGIDECRDAKKDAKLLFGFDEDKNNTLDTKEFACAIVYYAKAHDNVAIHDLIDFMCVTSLMGRENSKKFQEAYGRALGKDVVPKLKNIMNNDISSIPLPYFGIEEDD